VGVIRIVIVIIAFRVHYIYQNHNLLYYIDILSSIYVLVQKLIIDTILFAMPATGKRLAKFYKGTYHVIILLYCNQITSDLTATSCMNRKLLLNSSPSTQNFRKREFFHCVKKPRTDHWHNTLF